MTFSKLWTGKFYPGLTLFIGSISISMIAIAFVLDTLVSIVWLNNPIFKKITFYIHLYSRFIFRKLKNSEQ